MTQEQIELNYSKLIELVTYHVHNETLRLQLLKFLSDNKTSLTLAPASSSHSHHHAYEGGLLQHIIEVIRLGIGILELIFTDAPLVVSKEAADQMREDLVVSAVLHDIHKVGDPFRRRFYVPNMIKASKKKDEPGTVQSTKKPYVRSDDCYKVASVSETALAELINRNKGDLHEGELSLFYVNRMDGVLYSMLNDSVKFNCRYHDGAYGGGGFAMGGKETPSQQALHNADMISSRLVRWGKAGVDQNEENE